MVPQLTIAIALSLAGIATAQAIDFSPKEEVHMLDGARTSNLLFSDDKWDVTYQPPGGWSCTGAGNVLYLRDSNKDLAEAKIVASKATGAPIFMDAATLKSLRDRAQAMLPQGSENVQMVSEAKDTVMINGHETYEATFVYGFFGRKIQTCILFAFLDKEQFTVQVSSKPSDFAAVYGQFHGSLFSFQWQKSGS